MEQASRRIRTALNLTENELRALKTSAVIIDDIASTMEAGWRDVFDNHELSPDTVDRLKPTVESGIATIREAVGVLMFIVDSPDFLSDLVALIDQAQVATDYHGQTATGGESTTDD